MDQIPGATPPDPPTQSQDSAPPAEPPAAAEQAGAAQVDFGSRGRARRRARFLRKARELAYRDLGGLVFNLHRFGQRNDTLVLRKLTALGHIDDELRALETHLGEREAVTVLREAGITACPRCAAIHSSEDRFCPNCGLSMGRHASLPIGGAAPAPAAGAPAAQPAPAAAPAGPATHAAVAPAAHAAGAPGSPAPAAPAPAAPAPAAPASPLMPGVSTPAAPYAAPGARSPVPPGGSPSAPPLSPPAPAPAPAQPGSRDERELTEIIRPPAPDS